VAVAIAAALCIAPVHAQPPAGAAQAAFDRAVADFRNGRMAESVAGFDTLIKLSPDAAPQLWQRGIALYYAGRYKDCRAQFELHRTVNPDDVENAAWHFLCVARAESVAKARAALLPVGPDPRVPMGQVYLMLRVRCCLTRSCQPPALKRRRSFTRTCMSGLYYDALGDRDARSSTSASRGRSIRVGRWLHAHRRADSPRPASEIQEIEPAVGQLRRRTLRWGARRIMRTARSMRRARVSGFSPVQSPRRVRADG
jgi:lipoprotein NlpI